MTEISEQLYRELSSAEQGEDFMLELFESTVAQEKIDVVEEAEREFDRVGRNILHFMSVMRREHRQFDLKRGRGKSWKTQAQMTDSQIALLMNEIEYYLAGRSSLLTAEREKENE